jgi:hypothetical protein
MIYENGMRVGMQSLSGCDSYVCIRVAGFAFDGTIVVDSSTGF